MSTTILTDEQKAQFVTDITGYGTDFVAPLFAVVESIEQAVLQSPEVQARMEAYAAAKVREALDRAIAICDAAYEQGKGAYRASCDPYFEGGCDAAELIESRIRALLPPLPGPVEPTT